jgi:hypothetical protein
MLAGNPFYHRLTRKYVLAFGSLFNNITLRRYGATYSDIINEIKVPITYAPREKWFVRNTQDPGLDKGIQITLPRMSFYDAGRSPRDRGKLPSIRKQAKANNTFYADSTYVGVPWTLSMQLSIFADTVDDLNQIVEQILPTFHPDYTISLNPVEEMGFTDDIPVILNNVAYSYDFEGVFEQGRRVCIADLEFTMEVFFYGPVTPRKIIKKAYANTILDPSIQSGYITRVNLDPGNNGAYKLESLAYQGRSLNEATAAGIVLRWHQANNTLWLGGTQGTFRPGTFIHCDATNASHNLVSFDATPLKLSAYRVFVDPITAEPGDDFGYDEDYKEFPETM